MASVREQREAAEKNLGIHVVYETALKAREKLDEALTLLATARDQKRSNEAILADHEVDIYNSTWAANPDVAIGRMDKLVKAAIQKDPIASALRHDLAKISSEIEGLEYDITLYKVDIEVSSSRMRELGGYLEFISTLTQIANAAR